MLSCHHPHAHSLCCGTTSGACTSIPTLITRSRHAHGSSTITVVRAQGRSYNPEPKVLFSGKSEFNGNVQVIEIPDSAILDSAVEELRGFRVLLLDDCENIHSLWRKEAFITNSCWDYLATLAHLSPPGCIGILGLGAGTVANLGSQHYSGIKMQGWEIDPVVVEASRLCFGVGSLEKEGSLVVHVGDALLRSSTIEGGFSSIMVDLYADGVLLQQLLQVEAWQSIRHRLKGGIGGRVMANLGVSPRSIDGWPVDEDSVNTIKALSCMLDVFDKEVNVLHIRNMDGPRTMNVVALTGPFEGLQEAWVEGLPYALRILAVDCRWERWESSK